MNARQTQELAQKDRMIESRDEKIVDLGRAAASASASSAEDLRATQAELTVQKTEVTRLTDEARKRDEEIAENEDLTLPTSTLLSKKRTETLRTPSRICPVRCTAMSRTCRSQVPKTSAV